MLSTFELKARTERLLNEQNAAIAKLARQKEIQAKLAEQQRQREAQREEEARQKRLAQQEAAAKAEQQREEETEWNRGVWMVDVLCALPADDSIPLARGIRRSKDKVTLPTSWGTQLMNQDAAKNGAMTFQVWSLVTNQVTHAGLLDSNGPEGTVLLPEVIRSRLFGAAAEPSGQVEVKYIRLPKATFVRFQPLTRGFHENVTDVRHTLESALVQYSTLSTGDTLTVEHAGVSYTLRVVELQPAPACSIVDTDVEAEVVASVETEQLIREWEQEQARTAARLAEARRAREAEEAAQRAAAEELARLQREAEERAREEAERVAQEVAQLRAARLAALLPEPPASADPAQAPIACAVRLPEGGRIQRRFASTAPLSAVFAFVDAHYSPEVHGEYQLVVQFPRRALARPSSSFNTQEGHAGPDATLHDLGFKPGGQEAFLLEPLAPPS